MGSTFLKLLPTAHLHLRRDLSPETSKNTYPVQYNFCTNICNISKQKQLGLTFFIAISGVQLTKWCTQTGKKKAIQLYEGFIGVWCFLGFRIVMN